MSQAIHSQDLASLPFRAAFENLPQAAVLVAADGQVLAANRQMRCGDGDGDAGLPPFSGGQDVLLDTVFDPVIGHGSDGLMAALLGASADETVPLQRRGGGDRWFRVIPLGPPGRAHQLLLLEDQGQSTEVVFSELRAVYQHTATAAEAAWARNRVLAAQNSDLERFSAVAAHDLKAPLRNIANLLGYLEEDHAAHLPQDAKELVSMSRMAAKRLHALVDDLLAHAQSAAADLSLREISVSDAVATVAADLWNDIEAAGACVRCDGDPGRILADAALFHQVMANLIGNAVKYRADDRPPKVVVTRDGDALVVKDNGIGFEDAESEKIFAPFQRLHAAGEIEGTGVGLATCREICDRHHWTISATGTPGKGAVFRISGLSTPAG